MPGVESVAIKRWSRARGSRFGRWLFSRALGRYAPYTGTIGARVEELETGHAVVTMRDRKAVRNHLNSIHAVALSNLTEVSGSFAIIASMHPDSRMIPVRLETEYVKKARGTLTAVGSCEVPETGFEGELEGVVVIRDQFGEEVAHGSVTVLIRKMT